MREIKFRGKRLDNKKWVYGSLNTDNRLLFEILGYNGGDYDVDPNTIGQYTGLKDKNEKEIYEGSIVTYFNPYSEKHYMQIVKWCEIQSCFALFEEEKDVWSKECDWLKIIETLEVIGNIHDNKELLNN